MLSDGQELDKREASLSLLYFVKLLEPLGERVKHFLSPFS
jgi:hypothetical protein